MRNDGGLVLRDQRGNLAGSADTQRADDGLYELANVIELMVFGCIIDGDERSRIERWYLDLCRCARGVNETYELTDAVPPCQVFFQAFQLLDMHDVLWHYQSRSIFAIKDLRGPDGELPAHDVIRRTMRGSLHELLPYVVGASVDAEMAIIGMEGKGLRRPVADEIADLAEMMDISGCLLAFDVPLTGRDTSRLVEVVFDQGSDVCLRLPSGRLKDAIIRAVSSCDADDVDEEVHRDAGGTGRCVRWRVVDTDDVKESLPPIPDWVWCLGVREVVEGEGENATPVSSETKAYVLSTYEWADSLAWLLDADVSCRRDLAWWVRVATSGGYCEVRKHDAHVNRQHLREEIGTLVCQMGEKGSLAELRDRLFVEECARLPEILYAELPVAMAEGRALI